MLDRIANIIHECQLHTEKCLVVGVSGGPDSLCLLHSLHYLGHQVIAVHVNHGLRPDADKEEQQVKQFADHLGIESISCYVEVMKFAVHASLSIEEAARNQRYTSLFEQARRSGAQAVVVGHNADDQVETILLHLLRGSGLVGLRGMEYRTLPNQWSKDIPLIRPLLSTWRSEVQDYISDHHLTPVFDESNDDVLYFRNRLRHELLPILENYNPAIREVFLRMGQVFRDDYSVLEKIINSAWESTLIRIEKGFLAFRTQEFIRLPIAIQRYVLRRAISHLIPGLRDVDFKSIERGRMLVVGEKRNSQSDLIAGLYLIKAGDQFMIVSELAESLGDDSPAILSDDQLILTNQAIHILNHDWRLEMDEVINWEISNILDTTDMDPFQAYMDMDALELPLYARKRHPGDKIKPFGLNGHSIKISDLMINLKIPKRVRSRWPIICSGMKIVWVPGYRVSESVRIKKGTSRLIHLRLFRDRAA